jgi:molecular chaperone DnaJ
VNFGDPYEILGVSLGASLEEIKKAYKRLATQLHPDAGGDPAEFRKLTDAYNTLREKIESKESDPIFCEDASVTLELTLEEMAFGCQKYISVKIGKILCKTCSGSGAMAGSPMMPCISCLGTGKIPSAWGFRTSDRSCSTCRGAGTTPAQKCRSCLGKGTTEGDASVRVNIPPGVEHGQGLCFSGNLGGFQGRLFVTIIGLPHDRFERIGNDIVTQHKIGVCEAIIGASGSTTGLDGQGLGFKIRPGTQSGERIIVTGAGIRNSQTGQIGDLIIIAKIEVPNKLTPRAMKLVEELSDALTRK